MANWPAIGILSAAEVAVFLGATVRCLNAEARLDRERDSDIRAAVAGYESGQVVPALATLIEEVEELRSPGEALTDTLSRADVNEMLGAAVQASIRSQLPRRRERGLIHRSLALGVALLIAQIALPIAVFNVLTEGYNLPNPVILIAATSCAIAAIMAAGIAVLVLLSERSLAHAIKGGKDAA